MILSIIVILLALGIAFIHFIQGFFSATISLILIVLSAAIALGAMEPVVNMIKPGRFADSANASMMCLLFAISYIILRVIFDKAIPGNVRLNSTIDKVGAGVMGLLAGCFTAGLIAVAMQSMPFDAGSMATRYAVNPELNAGGTYKEGQQVERSLFNQLKSPTFEAKEVNSLILPVDEWVVGLVSSLSSGTLSTGHKWTDVHPDYLQELFGQRAGVQPGTKHVATNFANGSSQVTVEHVYIPKVLPLSQDGELDAVRKPAKDWIKQATPDKDKLLLIVRIKVTADAADATNGIFSFSPASVRMLVHPDGGSPLNIYPIGTLEGQKIWLNRIDDYLFADGKNDFEIDLVFSYPVDKQGDLVVVEKDAKTGQTIATVKDGTMLEVKRLARVDLSNQPADLGMPPAITGPGMLRQLVLKPEKKQ